MIEVTVEQVVGLAILILATNLMEFFIQVWKVAVEINIVGVAASGEPVAFCLKIT